MSPDPTLIQWVFDTRSWFPEATQTKHLETHPVASRVLAVLPPAEAAAALRYFHVRDAKMSLASSLIKHLAVAKLLPASAPWHATAVGRDGKTGKPVYAAPRELSDGSASWSEIAFNVTHQAGLVALIATRSRLKVDLGIDLVCTSERRDRDHSLIEKEGWPSFVDMHADVFSPREASYLKYQILSAIPGLLSPSSSPADVVDAKLRTFYALWALREAYVKLTGEALLASWLRDLEFRSFRPVAPTPAWDIPAREEALPDPTRYGAQVINDFEVWFMGRPVDDVNISLRALGTDYMLCTAARTPTDKEVALSWRLGPYQELDLSEMLEFAEAKLRESNQSWPDS